MTKEEISALAGLCKLEISEEEFASFAEGFEEMRNFAATVISAADGEEEEEERLEYSQLREDEVMGSLPAEKITSNVRANAGYFSVRRVVK